MRSVTNYYIANLALADIVIGLFAIPFEVTNYYLRLTVYVMIQYLIKHTNVAQVMLKLLKNIFSFNGQQLILSTY